MYRWTSIVKASVPILTLGVTLEIFAGQLLQYGQHILLLFPVFFISIPVINSVGGNIGSILGARIASGLHVGSISIDVYDKTLNQNLFTSILMGILTYFILAIGIYPIAVFLGLNMGVSSWEFVAIMLGAGTLLVCIICIASVFTALWSFKRGLDPDDMVAPVVTTIGDTLGIAFLFLFIGVIAV